MLTPGGRETDYAGYVPLSSEKFKLSSLTLL